MIRTLSGNWETKRAYINGREIPFHRARKYCQKSENEFSWGSYGTGAKQLSYAILYEILDDSDNCYVLYEEFNKDFILGLTPNKDFSVEFDIEKWIDDQLKKALKK